MNVISFNILKWKHRSQLYRGLQQILSMVYFYPLGPKSPTPSHYIIPHLQRLSWSWLYQCYVGSYKFGMNDLHDTVPKTINKQLTYICLFKSDTWKILIVKNQFQNKKNLIKNTYRNNDISFLRNLSV